MMIGTRGVPAAYIDPNRSSYLDTIKEESEARRTRFFKSNMAMIYAQSGTNPNAQNSTVIDNHQ